jgi:two-component system, sensor histidine kinase
VISDSYEIMSPSLSKLLDKATRITGSPSFRECAMDGPLVIVLEDDFANAWGLSLVLQDWGYRTVIGDSVGPVFEKLADQGITPQAAVCDFHLAEGENGVSAAARLQERYGSDLPVVIMTGSGGTTARRHAREYRFPVLNKPVDPDMLHTYLPAS